MKKKFRRAFVVEPTHDIGAVVQDAQDVVFLLGGFEGLTPDNMSSILSARLPEFDPDNDVIIPIGRIVANFQVGFMLATLFPKRELWMGIYKDHGYEYVKFSS